MAVLLSLGTRLVIGTWQPWWTLAKIIPGLAQVRNVYRFAYFFQLVIVLLGSLGLWRLYLRCERRQSRITVRGRVGFAVLAIAMALGVVSTDLRCGGRALAGTQSRLDRGRRGGSVTGQVRPCICPTFPDAVFRNLITQFV
jgi:hypothetical protein